MINPKPTLKPIELRNHSKIPAGKNTIDGIDFICYTIFSVQKKYQTPKTITKMKTNKTKKKKNIERTPNLGLKTEIAKLALVRYIRDLNLCAGDRLPPQETIRAELGLGNATITRALEELKREGILATKRRVGTYVVDPNADGYPARIIGIGSLQSGDPGVGPFFSCLLHHILTHLTELNCHAVIFHCKPTYGKWGIGLDYFPGLKRNVKQKRLDGVILMADISKQAWNWLEKNHMHPIFVGASTYALSGVMIDYRESTQQAIQILLNEGIKKPGVVIHEGITSKFVKSEFLKVTSRLKNFDPKTFYFEEPQGKNAPPTMIDKIYSLPKSKRPDGLAILDDQLANKIISEIVKRKLAGDDYLPKFVVQTNKQTPISFPIKPIATLEVDIDELASKLVTLFIDKLKGNNDDQKIIWVAPHIVSTNRRTNLIKTQS